jgi:hypothetical protein
MSEAIVEIDLKAYLGKNVGDTTTELIAEEILNFIVERTKKGKGMDGSSFPAYSSAYKNSDAFKLGGKTSKVNLTLSGEMLDSIEVIKARNGKLSFGYSDKNDMSGRAEGNITGSYGKPQGDSSKARRFLDISPKEIAKICNSIGELPESVQKKISIAAKKDAISIIEKFNFEIDYVPPTEDQ